MRGVQAGADFEAIILVPLLRRPSHQVFSKLELASEASLVHFGEVMPGALAGGPLYSRRFWADVGIRLE